MKLKFTWIFGAAMCLVLFSSSSSYSDNPNGKAGVTGAPGEQTCAKSGCHDTYTLNSGTGTVTIASPNLVNWEYTPGTTYTISVTVAQSGINLFGLCFEALQSNGDNAGTLHAGTGTQIKNLTVSGFSRHSITHNTNTGASANTHTFTFTWDAPTTDIGDVTFYVAGMTCNGNGNEAGDHVFTTSQVVTAAALGLNEMMDSKNSLSVYPNPASNLLLCPTSNMPSTATDAYIVDMQGRTVMTVAKNHWMQQDNAIAFDISSLEAGNYMLGLASNGRIIRNTQFIKK
jgi:Secretion system C-terminal sorting domain/Reeler domain